MVKDLSKPSDKPEWATDPGADVVTPSVSKQIIGWVKEKPPLQFFNWLFRFIYEWIIYFEDITDEAGTADFVAQENPGGPDLQVNVTSGEFYSDGDIIEFAGGLSPAFDPSSIPIGESRIDLLYIDQNNTLQIFEGTAAPSPVKPQPGKTRMPIAWVTLAEGQTQITNADIEDARAFFLNPESFINRDGDNMAGDLSFDAGVADPYTVKNEGFVPSTTTREDQDKSMFSIERTVQKTGQVELHFGMNMTKRYFDLTGLTTGDWVRIGNIKQSNGRGALRLYIVSFGGNTASSRYVVDVNHGQGNNLGQLTLVAGFQVSQGLDDIRLIHDRVGGTNPTDEAYIDIRLQGPDRQFFVVAEMETVWDNFEFTSPPTVNPTLPTSGDRTEIQIPLRGTTHAAGTAAWNASVNSMQWLVDAGGASFRGEQLFRQGNIASLGPPVYSPIVQGGGTVSSDASSAGVFVVHMRQGKSFNQYLGAGNPAFNAQNLTFQIKRVSTGSYRIRVPTGFNQPSFGWSFISQDNTTITAERNTSVFSDIDVFVRTAGPGSLTNAEWGFMALLYG